MYSKTVPRNTCVFIASINVSIRHSVSNIQYPVSSCYNLQEYDGRHVITYNNTRFRRSPGTVLCKKKYVQTPLVSQIQQEEYQEWWNAAMEQCYAIPSNYDTKNSTGVLRIQVPHGFYCPCKLFISTMVWCVCIPAMHHRLASCPKARRHGVSPRTEAQRCH